MSHLDLSILDRVKKRLYGEENQDTQVIPNFEESILFAPTQPLHDSTNTQVDTFKTSGVEAIKLPQLALDEAEYTKPFASTQVISKGPQLPVAESQSRPEELPPNEDRAQDRSIADAQLKADISHASLTDEENDLDDAADTTRDSSVQKVVTTKKELEEIEKLLSEQKRNRTIQPAFQKKSVDPVKQLVAAFDSDSEAEYGPSSDQVLKLSPTTSPMKVTMEKPAVDSDSESEFDATNVLDMITNPQLPKARSKRNPIDEYAQRIKRQIFSSPTRSQNGVIALDDSGDETGAESKPADVPKLTKEQQLSIKQKFSRKKLQRSKMRVGYSKFHQPRAKERGTRLLDDLRTANARQLNEMKEGNPDAELLEEIEKEEEEMGNLLEREMERVRRIRKKEKLQEKAKLALINGGNDEDDADYNDQNGLEDVPDSDVDPEESEFDDDSEEAQDSDAETGNITRPKRVVLSDSEDSDAEKVEPANLGATRHDDSYMFGGASDEIEPEEDVMQIQAGDHQSPSLKALDHVDHGGKNDYELFLNLAPRAELSISVNNSVIEDSVPLITEAPSFLDISETQDTNADTNLPTQADTQLIFNLLESLAGESTQADLYSDEDEEIPAAVARGRKLISKNALTSVQELEEEDEEEDNEKEQEMLKERLALYEAKIRRKELKARKRRKEMERRGIKNVVEGEAEESEDEWKGIGGLDDEGSDQANSEDERMIDNDFNLDLNDEEVRKKFMEQYQIKDRKELEKLIDDIKNHKLNKRARANRFDIELSDEEDELLMAYRRQKLQEQKQRLLANQKLMKLALNDKSKAFFESIQDEVINIALDEEHEEEVSGSDSVSKSGTGQNSQATEPDEDEEEAAAPAKKVIRIEEAFVQRQLSFLSRTEDDDYHEIQRISRFQDGAGSDDDIEDLSTLKSRSLSNLYTKSTVPVLINLSGSTKRVHAEVETDDDDDESFPHAFKKPSVVASFRSFQEKQGVQVSAKSFSGVTVNKQYKVASGSKASITYLSKAGKQKAAVSLYQNSKIKEIEETIGQAHRQDSSNKLFRTGGTFS